MEYGDWPGAGKGLPLQGNVFAVTWEGSGKGFGVWWTMQAEVLAGQSRTPAVIPGAAPPGPRLGRGRRIMINRWINWHSVWHSFCQRLGPVGARKAGKRHILKLFFKIINNFDNIRYIGKIKNIRNLFILIIKFLLNIKNYGLLKK
jgi:hypothetical protein